MEIPSCISGFKYHCISRLLLLLVAARGGDSGEKQGLDPSCPTRWSRMLLPSCSPALECSPKHTYCLLDGFWLALHPPSLCPWLLATFIY